MRKAFFALLLSILPSVAFAQSSPNWTFEFVPTTAQWNALWASKQDFLGAVPLLVTGGTMTGPLVTSASSASGSGFNLPPGVAPSSPNNGDLWTTSVGVFAQINGATVPLTTGSSGSFAATSPLTVSFPSGVVTYACATCGVTGSPLSQFAATTSAQLRGVLSDESGTGAALFQNGALGTATATSLAIGGATIGSNAFAVTGSSALSVVTGTSLALGGATIGSNALAVTGAFAFSAGGSFGGALSGITTLSASGQITSTLSTGTAPFVVASTTNVANLNASSLNGATFAAPGPIGSGTASSGAFTTMGLTGALTYGGVTLANSVTGTGSMVLSSAPSIAGLTVTTSFTATGLVTYADMATAAISTQAQYFSGASNVLVPASQIYQPEITVTFGTTTAFDFTTFVNAAVTLTGNITTMNITGLAGKSGQIRFIQDGTGSRTTVWNAAFKFAGGVTPTLSTAASAIDALEFNCTTTSYCVASLINNVK